MRCILCGGETKKMTVTFGYEEEGKHFLVENVSAEVCERLEASSPMPRKIKCGLSNSLANIKD